jgi:hypothetical protein
MIDEHARAISKSSTTTTGSPATSDAHARVDGKPPETDGVVDQLGLF